MNADAYIYIYVYSSFLGTHLIATHLEVSLSLFDFTASRSAVEVQLPPGPSRDEIGLLSSKKAFLSLARNDVTDP